MVETTLQEKFEHAAGVICRQGLVPFPVSPTAVAIVRKVVGEVEDELDLIQAFGEKPSQTLEQLAASSGLPAERAAALADSLARKGLVFNQPNSKGVMVYRLLPLMMVGVMEYKFMGPLTGSEEEKELAGLFETMLGDLREQTQGNFEALLPFFKAAPAIDRTVPAGSTADGRAIRVIPVDKRVEAGEEYILPSQTVEEIVAKFDDIAVGYCFCRQRRTLLGEPCASEAPVRNCFTFGKSARHTVAQGFAKPVTRDEALQILKEAEQAGLVHKAFHPGARESALETSICNCCKDCCDTFRLWRDGALPLINSTCHLAVIDADSCSGCGTCVDACPTDAIALNAEDLAVRDEAACLGCGVCARLCPEGAISLKEGLRRVFVLPPRLRSGREV